MSNNQQHQQRQDNNGHDDDDDEEEEEQEPLLLLQPMELTSEELEWTLALKQEVLEEDDLDHGSITDFDYAQVTLVCMDDLENAKYRLRALQDFREEYGITNNALEGIELILQFIQQQPWFLLDVHIDVDTGTSVFAQDFSSLDPTKVNSSTDWRIFLGGFYYIYQILQPNLAIIREGILVLAEVDGMGWKNFNIQFMQRHFHHLLEFYPFIIKESRFVHSSVIGNMLHSMLKRLRIDVPDSPIEIGCQLEELHGGRLEEMFKTPSEEVAQSRLINKCAEYLTIRYQNRDSFHLPTTTTTTSTTTTDAIYNNDIGGDDGMDGEEAEDPLLYDTYHTQG